MLGPCNLVPRVRGYHSTNYGILSSLLGLDPLDDSSVVLPSPPLIPIVKFKTVSRQLSKVPSGKNIPLKLLFGPTKYINYL